MKQPKEVDQQTQKKLARLKMLRLLDDTFMSKVFESKACVELLLRIILCIPDLVVLECRTQYELKNLQGRSIRLDIYARSGNQYFNIEIQRDERGTVFKRARYHCALLDANVLEPGESFEKLHESYVIFITENDVFGKGRPIYHVDRMVRETEEPFEDGSHIVYVNAQNVNEETDLGKLMSDFHCTKAEDMHYSVLAERVQYFKKQTEGVNTMCQIMEEIREEGLIEGRAQGMAEGRVLGVTEGLTKGKAEGRVEGKAEGKAEGEVRMIMRTMVKKGMTFQEAMEWFEIPVKEQKKYAKLMAALQK